MTSIDQPWRHRGGFVDTDRALRMTARATHARAPDGLRV